MRSVRVLVGALLVSLVVSAPVAAAKPMMERVVINDVGILDEFLADYCGFDVLADATGHINLKVWLDGEGNPTREVNNYGIRVRLYSAWGSVSIVDVGVDRVTYHADGSLTLATIGNVQSIQVPGKGRVYSDVGQFVIHVSFPEEGDPIVEVLSAPGQHSEEFIGDVLCELLAP